ncbi:MAG: HdeD family acid-resistance protein [Synechococcales cyanobacterium T60_A2020_003]|nr:HdeD family acid-resistance protein [Synechococcales cyanobacterium T60_A2020_003]
MNTDTELQSDIKKTTGWLIAGSILLILLGIAAIAMPGIASVTFTLILAWILLISGIVRIVKSFQSKPVRGFWLNLVVGILYAITGLYILFNPVIGTVSLTAALGILFIVEGIFEIIMSFQARPGGEFSWLVLLDGIITLILGILVWNQFPFSAIWLIGLYVGISLLFSGISLLVIALSARKTLSTGTQV